MSEYRFNENGKLTNKYHLIDYNDIIDMWNEN